MAHECLLRIIALVIQRRASSQSERFILTGTRVDGTETIRLPEPSAEATVKSLRLIALSR
jgi:hypothetical protein